jgi:1-deoxy-D-xylulose-5-phosphate reductoisomerase
MDAACERIDWRVLTRLAFEQPDEARFPAIGFARRVMRAGGTAGAIMNAANEEAVAAYLRHAISFGGIARLVGGAMDDIAATPIATLHDVRQAEAAAREHVRQSIAKQELRA